MKLDITFSALEQKLDADFGEIQTASDGGYERGYAEGFEKGEAQGYASGKVDGYEEGYPAGYEQGYNEGLVIAPPGYRRAASGTIIFTTSAKEQTIRHNLGVKPSMMIMYPLNNTLEEMETVGGTWAWRYADFSQYGSFSELSSGYDTIYEYFRNSSAFTPTTCTTRASNVTESTAKIGYRSASSLIPAGVEFGWLAIE